MQRLSIVSLLVPGYDVLRMLCQRILGEHRQHGGITIRDALCRFDWLETTVRTLRGTFSLTHHHGA